MIEFSKLSTFTRDERGNRFYRRVFLVRARTGLDAIRCVDRIPVPGDVYAMPTRSAAERLPVNWSMRLLYLVVPWCRLWVVTISHATTVSRPEVDNSAADALDAMGRYYKD